MQVRDSHWHLGRHEGREERTLGKICTQILTIKNAVRGFGKEAIIDASQRQPLAFRHGDSPSTILDGRTIIFTTFEKFFG
jgi:hypothetical protein